MRNFGAPPPKRAMAAPPAFHRLFATALQLPPPPYPVPVPPLQPRLRAYYTYCFDVETGIPRYGKI